MASTDSQNQLFNFSAIFATEKFQGENEKGIFDAVLQGHIDFESTKDLLRKMLTADPKKRITAAEVLEHPWLREGEAPDHPIDGVVLTRMKQLRVMNKLKKLALKVIAESLPDDEIQGLKQMFENMDTDDSNDNYGTGASPEYQFPGTVNKKAQMHFNPYMDLVILDLSI